MLHVRSYLLLMACYELRSAAIGRDPRSAGILLARLGSRPCSPVSGSPVGAAKPSISQKNGITYRFFRW